MGENYLYVARSQMERAGWRLKYQIQDMWEMQTGGREHLPASMASTVVNAIYAALNGIAVGFNAAGLIFLQREETWFMWFGMITCGGLMVWFCLPPKALKKDAANVKLRECRDG